MAAILEFLKMLKGVATTPVGEGQNPLKTTMYHISPDKPSFA